jgi:hypothetical protein
MILDIPCAICTSTPLLGTLSNTYKSSMFLTPLESSSVSAVAFVTLTLCAMTFGEDNGISLAGVFFTLNLYST